MKLLVDGDIVVYATGFVAEKHYWTVDCEEAGCCLQFKTKAEVYEYNKGIDKDEIYSTVVPRSEEFVRQVLDSTLKGWCNRFNTRDMDIYLTASGLEKNFRWKLDNTYKANRKNARKPHHYKFIRQLLIREHGAKVVTGIEADDILGINQTHDTVIISKDKDLLQVPGMHYNTMTGDLRRATREGDLTLERKEGKPAKLVGHGFKFFCAQMLLGDAIDNIKGLKGVGPVAAHGILKDIKEPRAMWEEVKKQYVKHKREADIILNANLLFILREAGGFFDESRI